MYSSCTWVTAAELASVLRVHYNTVCKIRKRMRRGYHYITLNPDAQHPSYRFCLERVNKFLEKSGC
jgi:hypothetical protein